MFHINSTVVRYVYLTVYQNICYNFTVTYIMSMSMNIINGRYKLLINIGRINYSKFTVLFSLSFPRFDNSVTMIVFHQLNDSCTTISLSVYLFWCDYLTNQRQFLLWFNYFVRFPSQTNKFDQRTTFRVWW